MVNCAALVSRGVLVLSLLLPSGIAISLEVPKLTGRVVDQAKLMTSDAISRVNDRLRNYEQSSSHQVAVLTVPSLETENLEEFTSRVFHTWALGQKGQDNGVLLLVAAKEQKLRIEVGYGLEHKLTDIKSLLIVKDRIAPQFKMKNFSKGIEDGVSSIIDSIEGVSSAVPQAPQVNSASSSVLPIEGITQPEKKWLTDDDVKVTGPGRAGVAMLIFGGLGSFSILGILPGVSWFIYFLLIPFWAAFPMFIVGISNLVAVLVAYLTLFPILKWLISRTPWGKKFQKPAKASLPVEGGWSSSDSGSWSSSSDSSSSSSESFSGGGGDSGGGGASGSW